MISRMYLKCKTCSEPITARVQIGHQDKQSHVFQCPSCGTDVGITLLLHRPPHVEVQFDSNCERGEEEGKIINLSSGFTIHAEDIHKDLIFPAFKDFNRSVVPSPMAVAGAGFEFPFVGVGGFAGSTESWQQIKKGLRFHRIGRLDLRDQQITPFLDEWKQEDRTIDNALFVFLGLLLGSHRNFVLGPLDDQIELVIKKNEVEFQRLIDHYDSDLKKDRFLAYEEIISDFFKSYDEFSQTLAFAANDDELAEEAVATSANFDSTKMFYGNAFELLGSHLDLVAAMNNILCGRDFDKMNAIDLKKYRTTDKAGRTKCFSQNAILSWFVDEYDSHIRNASHHRWFKMDEAKRNISYRSGGTGELRKMTYAQYIFKCNRMFIRIAALASWELMMLRRVNKSL